MPIDPSQIKISYGTRAEAQAAWIPSAIQHIMVGGLLFQGDSGGDALKTNSGTRGWSPLPWGITPQHWAENTTPGTIDMTAALLAAATFADAISDLDTMTYQVKVDLLGQRLAISETDDDGSTKAMAASDGTSWRWVSDGTVVS